MCSTKTCGLQAFWFGFFVASCERHPLPTELFFYLFGIEEGKCLTLPTELETSECSYLNCKSHRAGIHISSGWSLVKTRRAHPTKIMVQQTEVRRVAEFAPLFYVIKHHALRRLHQTRNKMKKKKPAATSKLRAYRSLQ